MSSMESIEEWEDMPQQETTWTELTPTRLLSFVHQHASNISLMVSHSLSFMASLRMNQQLTVHVKE